MCGIAGFELGADDQVLADRLLERLERRGPDGSSFTRVQPYGLVHTRLAVIDLSNRVRYPLQNESGDLHLLFNGEIYEYERHRAELQRLGHSFSTGCDAEVVVHGYEEWGADVFSRLDGMFALALFYEPSRELVLVRDALGIKPLVYTCAGRFAFSSDAISLVAAGLSRGEIDPEQIEEYLAFHYIPPPGTGLRDVSQLQPGEMLRRSATGETVTERWRPRPFSRPRDGESVAIGDLGAALDRSVRRQLMADVPVGVFLSSGLDSSLVLDSAVRAGARPMAFTIGFPGHGDYDESAVAARFARERGVTHVIAELSGGFVDTIDSLSAAFDQPFGDASAIATAQLAKLARGHVTVALTGTGGDDLLAGYYRHRAHLVQRLLKHLPPGWRRMLATAPVQPGSERRSLGLLTRSYLTRLAAVTSDDPFAQYLELVGSPSDTGVADATGRSLDPVAIRRRVAGRYLTSSPRPDALLRRIQSFELETYVPGDLLTKEDRATMAVGLEGRVPLLGAELLELAEHASERQQIGLLSGKRLLREVARTRLPGYITRGRKRGFAVPLGPLLKGPWLAEAVDWFAAARSSVADGETVSRQLREGTLAGTDAWALASLLRWEAALGQARLSATRTKA